MSGSDEKSWMKRYNWAICREPYKTELDTLASHWIEGQLSNEALALEILQIRQQAESVSESLNTLVGQKLDDVHKQVKILTDALLSAILDPELTPERRRAALDFMRSNQNQGPDR